MCVCSSIVCHPCRLWGKIFERAAAAKADFDAASITAFLWAATTAGAQASAALEGSGDTAANCCCSRGGSYAAVQVGEEWAVVASLEWCGVALGMGRPAGAAAAGMPPACRYSRGHKHTCRGGQQHGAYVCLNWQTLDPVWCCATQHSLAWRQVMSPA